MGKQGSTTQQPRKRPVIEVMGARPMSEVGFRDTNGTAATDRKSLPPPRPAAVPPRPPGKPPRPASIISSNNQDEVPNTATLIDFDSDVPGSNKLYPDLLSNLNSQPDVAVAHQKSDDNAENEFEVQPAPVQPSSAMSQLALIMKSGVKKADSDEEAEDDEWGENVAPVITAPVMEPAPAALNRPLPSPIGRPLPSAPAAPNRPLPPAPANRPLPSAPVNEVAPNRPLPPAPANRPLPSAPANEVAPAVAPANRPLPSLPQAAPSRTLPPPPARPHAAAPAPGCNGLPPPIPSRTNIPSPTEDMQPEQHLEEEQTRPKSLVPNAAMSQLAAIMNQGNSQTNSAHSKANAENAESLTPLMQSPAKTDFQDSFYSENEQSMVQEEEESIPKPQPPKNPALASLASVFNSAPSKPVPPKPVPTFKPVPMTKPKPAVATKPKPGLKPKPAAKPKPGVLPKPGENTRPAPKTFSKPPNQMSSSMVNLAAVMKGKTPDDENAENEKKAAEESNAFAMKKSQSDYVGFQASRPAHEDHAKEESLNVSDDPVTESQLGSSMTRATSEPKISPVQKKFGGAWMLPKLDARPDSIRKSPRKEEKEVVDSDETISEEPPKEVAEPSLLPKKPGPAPMRATYRPTIIKPTAKPKTEENEKEQNNNAEEPHIGKLNSRAISMFNLDATQSDESDKKESSVQMKPKKKPTIIRPPSMTNLSTTAKEEEKKRPEPRPIPRDRPKPSPRSRMSAACSMPNLAQGAEMSLQGIDFDDTTEKEAPMKPPPPAVLRSGPPARPRPPSFHAGQTAAMGSQSQSEPVKPSVDHGKKTTPPAKPPPPRPGSAPRRASIGSNIICSSGAVQGLPPALPDRPGPGHPLYHYVVKGPHAIAVYDYEATQAGDLSFKAGEVIQLKRKVDEEWLEGSNGAGQQGMFPVNFVDVIEPPPEDSSQQLPSGQAHHPSEPSPSLSPASTITGPRCVARYDYESDDPADLVFMCGDVIALDEWVGEDWLRGRVDGRAGIFPMTFVEIVEELPQPSESEPAVSQPSIPQPSALSQPKVDDTTVTALYDYQGDEGDLAFKAGDSISVLSEVSAEWLYGQSGSQKGQFPTTFIDRIPRNLPKYSPEAKQSANKEDEPKAQVTASLGSCVALFPYPGEAADDLCFNEGDVITIVEKIDDQWMKGTLNGITGMFPTPYVKINENGEINPEPSAQQIPVQEPAKTGLAVAEYDFPGQSEDDLSFTTGDTITLLEIIDDAWMRGEVHGKQGIFPANFVTVTKPLE